MTPRNCRRRLVGLLLAAVVGTGLVAGPVTGASAGPVVSAVTPPATNVARGAAAREAAAAPTHGDVQRLLDEMVTAGITGVLARVDDGRRVQTYASGVLDIRSHQPETASARFRVGSISKSFTATVLLQLVGEGKLRLSDPLSRWLPGLVPNGSHITVQMLLNHTSGLYDYTQDPTLLAEFFADPRRVWRPQELVRVAFQHPPLFAPGTSWSYSNTNFVLAGLVAQAVTGQPLPTLVRQRIIKPLGLHDTSYPVRSPYIDGVHAHGYYPPSLLPPGSGYLDVTAFSPSAYAGAGSIVSTAHDLARFYAALLGGRLLKPAQLRQMETRVPLPGGLAYGLGLFSQSSPCGTVWGHNGHVPGYLSIAYNDRAGHRSVVLDVSTEADTGTAPLIDEAGLAVVCQMFGRSLPAAAAPPAVALSPLVLSPALVRAVG